MNRPAGRGAAGLIRLLWKRAQIAAETEWHGIR